MLLLRHTGMRIGRCLDLPSDCLRRIGQDQSAIHVPLGKLRTERLVPADSFVCRIVDRLRSLRCQDPRDANGFLLSALMDVWRSAPSCALRFTVIAAAVGIKNSHCPAPVSALLWNGDASRRSEFAGSHEASRPQVAQHDHALPRSSLLDVQHEFELARQQPRHLLPTLTTPSVSSATPDLSSLLGSLQVAQHVLEMYRRLFPLGRLVVSLTGSPTASPRSPQRPAVSAMRRNFGRDWPVVYLNACFH